MLNYNHLYYFHITACEGAVARAAQRLGVGQPTVSEQIRQLERTLSMPLFERTGGRLRLTDAGRRAFEHTSVMFRAGERLVESLVGVNKAPPITLRVGLSVAVGRAIATDFLMPVLAMDECVPSIRTGDFVDLLRELRATDLDLVLCESDPGDAARLGIELVAIHHPRLVAITAAADDPKPHWDDIALIQYRPGSVYRYAVEGYLDEHNLHPRIAAETDDALLMLSAVARGGFVAFVPGSVAREAVAAGTARVVAKITTDNPVYALYHDAEHASVARRAVELLVDCAAEV